jgi:hypothetical protein
MLEIMEVEEYWRYIIIWHMATLLADERDRTENRPPPHSLSIWWLELASLG